MDPNKVGVLDTNDELTEEFFSGTKVQVANVPRIKESLVMNEVAKSIYTHHQKFVIVDAGEPGEIRHLEAFLGGIDLTSGRYDTPEYKLFDYKDTHYEDFYQNIVLDAQKESGPREPWHDIHCKVVGPVTRDILDNFEARWKKQVQDKVGSLYKFNAREFDMEYSPVDDEENGGLYDMQIYRSIPEDSCVFDTNKHYLLTGKKGGLVDNSILRAYVHQIRQAEHFIYIENQYFMGSAYLWDEHLDAESKHTVPGEIVAKIVQKIKKGERFMAYIVLPLFPEGDPTSTASQEILYWQNKTMRFMYNRIGNAIQDEGLESHPTDYLMFFSPCKSESPEQVPYTMPQPDPDTEAYKIRQSLRFPIYVHSKMMIVDDDFIIVGSANINHRSMSGTRDTEIAVGATQPNHLARDHAGQPRGAIHTFRLALWCAHLGGFMTEFQDPSSQECVDLVKSITAEYRDRYISDEPEFSQVHLLQYPIQVGQDGGISEEPGWENFPDTEASVFGSKSPIPASLNKLTT